MSLTIPYTFTGGVGHKIKASEVNACFQAVANKFTEGAGGIANADIASAAGIVGTKISNTPGSRIPYDRLEDAAVDKDALRDDANAGAPNAAVNSANHIKDAIITNAKLVDATLLTGKAKILVYSKACDTLFGTTVISAGQTIVSTYENSVNIVGAPDPFARDKSKVMPLFVYIEQTVAGPPNASNRLRVSLDTTTNDNVIYFKLHNYDASTPITIPSDTLKFVYWSIV